MTTADNGATELVEEITETPEEWRRGYAEHVARYAKAPGELFDPSQLPPIDYVEGGDPSLIADELRYVIERWILAHPRSQQRQIGPSEIGTPCARRLAFHMADHPRPFPESAAWRPTVGTAVHAWLEATFEQENASMYATHGTFRYLTERRVQMGTVNGYGDIDGTGDVYDRQTGTVIDWKVVGPSNLPKYRRNMRREYIVQCHGYGRGWSALGLPVQRIMVVCLPMNGELSDMVAHAEPYSEEVALQAIARAERVHGLVKAVGIPGALTLTNGVLRDAGLYAAADPKGLAEELAIPLDASDCTYCPWLKAGSKDLATGCPGAPGMKPRFVAGKPSGGKVGAPRSGAGLEGAAL